jgi:hypothetical protein
LQGERNGARRIRTADLLGAIQALCQLSYSPGLAGGKLLPVPRKRQDNRIVFDSLPAEMASMSILDDAIREHLELKRAHGADESEIKRLEDEAFGPPGRPEEPDPMAEAPTELLGHPGEEEEGVPLEAVGGRRINIADLQEAPPEPGEPPEEPRVEVTEGVESPQAEATPVAPAEDAAQAAPPAEEEPPAMEHDVVAEAGPSTEERHAIAEQPTELFDVEAEIGTEDAPAPAAPTPSDEEILESEAAEPRLAPVEPATEIHAARTGAEEPVAEEDEEDEEFWSDQRLSEELDQALEAPLADEQDVPAATAPVPPAEPPAPLFDRDEDAEGEDEQRTPEQREPVDYDPDTGHEDVLEDTPDFLEDAPEDDELWFEQRPPKDFNFDD